MVYRYRTNLKKVFLTDSELHQLNERIAKSNCQNFSVYARKVLLNPNMSFVTINTDDTYDQLVFELRRIGNNINQIARAINQSRLISQEQLQELSKGVGELIKEVDKEFQVEVKRLKEFHGSH
ncbi:mobilisation protein [Streptococcus pneumoniae]|nr:mobilisation protein [Streptococcus pneumoniae]